MPAANPRVSIGIPVYNGQRYLRETIESVLAQTYTDFELIICDNASTDQTPAICEEFQRRDPRVRYCRHDRNLGPANNYNACFELARGELFKWQAADDLIAPQFIEQCVAMLDRDPSLVSVYTRTILIDEQGHEIGKYAWDLELDHPSPVVRFARMVFVNHRRHNAHEFWGVTRSSLLRQTPMKGSFPSADRILMSWWTLLGKMGRVEEYLFFNREHDQRSQRATPPAERRPGSRLSRLIGGGPMPPYEWWDSSKRGAIVYPEWRWVWEYLRAARGAKVTAWQRIGALGAMAGLYTKFAPRLARDLLIAAELCLYRFLRTLHLLAPTPRRAPHRPARVHVLPRRAA